VRGTKVPPDCSRFLARASIIPAWDLILKKCIGDGDLRIDIAVDWRTSSWMWWRWRFGCESCFCLQHARLHLMAKFHFLCTGFIEISQFINYWKDRMPKQTCERKACWYVCYLAKFNLITYDLPYSKRNNCSINRSRKVPESSKRVSSVRYEVSKKF